MFDTGNITVQQQYYYTMEIKPVKGYTYIVRGNLIIYTIE